MSDLCTQFANFIININIRDLIFILAVFHYPKSENLFEESNE